MNHVDVDERTIAHDFALGRVDESHPAHVRRELINDIECTRFQGQRCLTVLLLAQVEQPEIVCRSGTELGPLKVYAPDPEPLLLEPPDEVTRDEATRAAYQCSFHRELRDA